MQDLQKGFNELNITPECALVKQFEPDEKMLISTTIIQLGDKHEKQEHNFVLTEKYLYNLDGDKIERKVPVSKITGITVSTVGDEFLIHVADEDDCRYMHADKRTKITDLLNDLSKENYDKAITLEYKDELSLEPFVTNKHNVKKEKKEEHHEKPHAKHETHEKQEKPAGNKDENYETIYSKDKDKNVTLDDFQLLKVLGRGTFGKVMLAKKKDSGLLYAIKSMKKADLVEKEQLEHTKTEKMILQNINHPFLVNLDYCFQTREKIFFVMQFMRGGELFQHLRKDRRFPESRVKFYAAQLAVALGHLHSNNVIYRDMKPENLLMDEDGYLAISDFGMAKVLVDDALATSFCGTPEYLAPEVITSEGHGRDADWWGLGVLVYELIIGIPPFYHQNHHMMFEMIQNAPVKFHPQIKVSDEAKNFILRCLEKNPNIRLGHKNDIQEIKSHPWFKDIDWDALIKKEIPAPFKPVFHSEISTEYFDEEFTSEEAINSYSGNINPEALKEFDEQFESVAYYNQ